MKFYLYPFYSFIFVILDNLDSDVLANKEFGGEGMNSDDFQGVNFRCETFDDSDWKSDFGFMLIVVTTLIF